MRPDVINACVKSTDVTTNGNTNTVNEKVIAAECCAAGEMDACEDNTVVLSLVWDDSNPDPNSDMCIKTTVTTTNGVAGDPIGDTVDA